jgi:Flp pilus assembly protein TadB
MENLSLMPILIIALGALCAGALLGCVVSQMRSTRVVRALGGVGGVTPDRREGRLSAPISQVVAHSNLIKDSAYLKQQSKHKRVSLEEQFFQAGYLAAEDQSRFFFIRSSCIVLFPLALGALTYCVGAQLCLVGIALGIVAGRQVPISLLRRAKERRDDEIVFYLPLVIDQLVIGVSSSLDIGPCMKWILEMADDRDSHNAVTELLRYSQNYMRSGVGLEESLLEVGRLSGHAELKHVLMSLSRVTKHGGDITRQLQELASAVTAQREARIDGKVKKLELEATGPVGLVFGAFMVTLLVTLGSQMALMFK